MSDTPKRPWFRFHLLTAVMLMLTAGVLVWANVTDSPDAPLQIRGWPWTFYKCWPKYPLPENREVTVSKFSTIALFGNILAIVIIVFAVAVLSEFILRRIRKS